MLRRTSPADCGTGAVQVETVENSTNVEIIFGRNVNFI
jgi:hypothetical protein